MIAWDNDLTELIGNLLDNAAKEEARHRVGVSIEDLEGTVLMTVGDDEPGIQIEHRTPRVRRGHVILARSGCPMPCTIKPLCSRDRRTCDANGAGDPRRALPERPGRAW